MAPKQDIKWFELIFDVIFVVGLSKLIAEISTTAENVTIVAMINAIVLFLILFNAWIRVTMLENKIKVIERYLGTSLKRPTYKAPVFIQLALILGLIFTFNINFTGTLNVFIFIYMLLTFSNALLFVIRPLKIFIVFIIFILSLFVQNQEIVIIIFLFYLIYESYYTFKNLRTIANSIFKHSRFRPSIINEFDEIDRCILSYSDFRRKLYVPHLIERLGIAMVVFLAEYVLVSLATLGEYEGAFTQIFLGFIFFMIFFLFYYNYYSSIEHIDEVLLHEKDKRKKYKKGKISVYVIILYFLAISGFAYMIKNFHADHVYESALVFGAVAYLFFEAADIILFKLYNEAKSETQTLYYVLKVCLIISMLVVLVYAPPVFILTFIVICLGLNIVIGKKLTNVDYIIH